MNTMGWIRGYMAKNNDPETFIIHVGSIIEKQLQEWDKRYSVNIMKFTDYHFTVKHKDTYYDELSLTIYEVSAFKNKGPYSLDQHIWLSLQQQGIDISIKSGNYMDHVFM